MSENTKGKYVELVSKYLSKKNYENLRVLRQSFLQKKIKK
ncbi:hypothetical protein UABAM_05967 [Candidatus Uabimicrobium amorphum]|uniref:Uncharacterized protein n=1 Tax=Uabimicrobium amorphum TaxID=2596890 RepID=A0A5S9IVY8_UABAM|nr:hypothetical protein UABAM_05967 [Candidatus Uabimicrobium amorphum]